MQYRCINSSAQSLWYSRWPSENLEKKTSFEGTVTTSIKSWCGWNHSQPLQLRLQHGSSTCVVAQKKGYRFLLILSSPGSDDKWRFGLWTMQSIVSCMLDAELFKKVWLWSWLWSIYSKLLTRMTRNATARQRRAAIFGVWPDLPSSATRATHLLTNFEPTSQQRHGHDCQATALRSMSFLHTQY